MVDFDVSTPFGTSAENATDVFQDQWNRMFQAVTGDGIVGELTTSLTGRFAFTASGSDTNIIITPNSAAATILGAGHTGRLIEAKAIDIDEDGAPGSGVRRIDWVVARVNRSGQKMELDVVPGSPGTNQPPTLTTDRGGDLEIPLALIDRTGPVNLTNAMITPTHARPAPGFFLASGLGATSRNAVAVPDGGFLIQGWDIYNAVTGSNGTVMQWRQIGNPPWSNLSLASGYTAVSGATPQYRVVRGEFQLRGIVQRSGSAWSNGANIATFPLSVRDSMPDAGPTWHRHDSGVLYPSSSALGSGSVTPVRVQMTDSGGRVYLPNAAGANSALNRLDLSGVSVNP